MFKIITDANRIVMCRVYGFLPDDEASSLASELLAAVNGVRARGRPLRMIFDNRHGAVFSAKASEALQILQTSYDERDRIAVLVSGSLNKLQAKRTAGRGTEVFMSEDAARTWLKAWDSSEGAAITQTC